MTKLTSVQEAEIPLWLLPQAIARLIRQQGDAVYRISVKRTHWHHYNVSVRTKRITKELRPSCEAVLEPATAPATVQTARKRGRGCPV